ncbi:MAG TPA: FlgD immunoglobulin-like domain containing protein [bacterium]|nr:FlgD immunoglobulin-like domain containing protein [bacterium]
MRSLAVLVVLLALSACALGSGWVGQGRVDGPNDGPADQQPVVGVDPTGRPWVVWNTNATDTSLLYSTWNGTSWGRGRAVSANDSGVWGQLLPDVAFDGQDRAWLVWNNGYENNSSVIAACHWDDSQWSAEQQVSPPDSDLTDVYFAPRVSCGGGQVWCVWYGGPSDALPYSVYASRWDSLKGRWGQETRVSPPDGNDHWWCDVAVDSLGTPHVVWCTHPLYTVFYSYFDGQRWVAPTPVNDTTQFTASPWASPRIVIDRTGVMQLCFTGAKVGASHRDILYTQDKGSGWLPCQMVTHDSVHDVWYSDIAADRPDNVWIAYDRQGEGTDQFRVYATHLDGHAWSSEQRLSSGMSSRNQGPALALDAGNLPWVVWQGVDSASGHYGIYYDRYASAGVAEGAALTPPVAALTQTYMLPHGCAVTYDLLRPAHVRLDVYSLTGRLVRSIDEPETGAGRHAAVWDGKGSRGRNVSAGVYVCRLQLGEEATTVKLVLVRH